VGVRGGNMIAGQVPIQMLIEKEWAVDSITSLGSGYQFHLTYAQEQLEPELLIDLRAQRIQIGHPMEIIHATHRRMTRVAIAELASFSDCSYFIRLDFRILQVPPYLRNGIPWDNRGYCCRYKP
jgi:hypothetical protein